MHMKSGNKFIKTFIGGLIDAQEPLTHAHFISKTSHNINMDSQNNS